MSEYVELREFRAGICEKKTKHKNTNADSQQSFPGEINVDTGTEHDLNATSKVNHGDEL